MGPAAAIFGALWWTSPAHAQVAPAADAPLPSAQIPPSLAGDVSWRRIGLVGAGACDIAVLPDGSGAWVAVTDTGEVWVTLDGGATFSSVLGRSSAEVDPRRRLEARIQELIDDLRAATDGASPFVELTDEAAIEVLQREIATLQDQLDELGQEERGTPILERSLLPRAWAADDAIFVGRGDGLWRSDDRGATWRQVLDVPTHGLARIPGRTLWAAGTDDGMRFSVDGVAWLDPEDGTEGLQVADVATGQDGAWAATGDGVWFAADGQVWQRIGGVGPSLRVRPDPEWVQGAWIATEAGVLRTDDGGVTVRPGGPLPGTSSLLWLGPGRLLAAGSDGVWESLDGGLSWAARSRGLTDPDTRALAQDGTTLLLAAEQGIYVLSPGAPEVESASSGPAMPLAPLIAAATGRIELVQKTGSRWAATFMPRLQLDGGWVQSSAIDWALLTGTSSTRDSAWGVTLGLTWTPRAQTNLDDALLPIDALWVADTGAMSQAFAASTTREASRYRVALSHQVADLYFARAELEAARASTTSLGEAVENVLRISEIDARIDSLTNGALSRLRADPSRENP